MYDQIILNKLDQDTQNDYLRNPRTLCPCNNGVPSNQLRTSQVSIIRYKAFYQVSLVEVFISYSQKGAKVLLTT